MTDHNGVTVVHRRYIPHSEAHYGGSLVDGAWALASFGDVATEICIRTDADEGLFASYSDVQFKAPIRAGDMVEAQGTIVRTGNRSRTIEFELRVTCRSNPGKGDSAAEVLDPPESAVTATGTVVVP
ncbi:3-aminobutyryl-CoA ammonia lyase [Salininema proteolyticum]|uniref:Hotdog domain-containing protein n=1 Tax=Salininema proteolyticum TaxID=1607685 RepID=A0ABV8U1F5_9ACTN